MGVIKRAPNPKWHIMFLKDLIYICNTGPISGLLNIMEFQQKRAMVITLA